MKFRIMCTVHNCDVLLAADLADLPDTVRETGAGVFEIAEDNLYCNFRQNLDEGRDHNFRIVPL